MQVGFESLCTMWNCLTVHLSLLSYLSLALLCCSSLSWLIYFLGSRLAFKKWKKNVLAFFFFVINFLKM